MKFRVISLLLVSILTCLEFSFSACKQEVQKKNRFSHLEFLLSENKRWVLSPIVIIDSSLTLCYYAVDSNYRVLYYKGEITQGAFDSIDNMSSRLPLVPRTSKTDMWCGYSRYYSMFRDSSNRDFVLNENLKFSSVNHPVEPIQHYIHSQLKLLKKQELDIEKDSLNDYILLFPVVYPPIEEIIFFDSDEK